jgi:predicted nucleic acid-binding protein
MINAFIDCNILLDWLMEREPFSYNATKIIEYAEEGKIKIYVSGLVLANVHYLISNMKNKKIANEFIKDSLRLFHFTGISQKTIVNSIKYLHKDFEDDLHYFTAVENKLDYIVTRNKNDFQKEKIKVVDSEEFITLITSTG